MENRNWREVKLGDIIDIISKKTPIENATLENYISTENMINDFGGVQNAEKLPTTNTVNAFVENDILFSNIRTYFKKVWHAKFDGTVSQDVLTFRAKENIISKFLYYILCNPEFTEYTVLTSKGAKMPRGDKDAIRNFEIQLPQLPEQKAIASVLSSLDDKIDLLHQQNQTLEALAETLYLNFIGEREFNSKLSDIFSLQNGYAFKSKSFKESGIIRVIKIKNISGDIVDITNSDFVDDESIKKLDVKFKINSGDILIAMTGAEVGKLGIVPETDQSLWLNQRVGSIKQKFEGAKYLVYLHLKSDFGQDYIENTATGSAQPNISGEGIENCEFPLYEEAELEEICNKLSPLYDKVIFNLGQIQTLTKLRDTLLPKLMSGEVRVKI